MNASTPRSNTHTHTSTNTTSRQALPPFVSSPTPHHLKAAYISLATEGRLNQTHVWEEFGDI